MLEETAIKELTGSLMSLYEVRYMCLPVHLWSSPSPIDRRRLALAMVNLFLNSSILFNTRKTCVGSVFRLCFPDLLCQPIQHCRV